MVYIDFWGWNGSDPDGEQPYLINFLSSIGNSAWIQTLSQYHVGVDPKLAGEWNDNSSTPPIAPTIEDISNELMLQWFTLAYHFDSGADRNRTSTRSKY